MVEFKLNIADPKTGKCYQRAVTEPATDTFIGLRIGDKLKGDNFELSGYEFEITGGSDFCGFPMRKGISGERKRVLAEKGVGFRKRVRGMKKRKSVCGNSITKNIIQINLKVLKEGKQKLGGEAKPEEGKEAAPAKQEAAPAKQEAAPAPKEEKKAEPKKEAPKEETKKE